MGTELFGGLAADILGETDERAPLVLLHGLSFDRRQWSPMLAELARLDPGRRVLAVDLPGHGGSPARDSYGLDEVARAVRAAVVDAGLEAPVVVGHSLGGVLATVYAAAYPASRVINVDQPLLVGGFAAMLRQVEPVLRGPDYGRVWRSMMDRMGVDLLPPEARPLVEAAGTPPRDLLLGYWHEVLTEPVERLTQRRASDLAIIGASGIAYDYVTGAEPDPAYRQWLEAALPDVAVTVLPGSGHFPHLARPRELAGILAAQGVPSMPVR
ncbi:Pimeloyl-ACP methyl ester carboxylesterase [Asanoa ishikariensis]|uniref:Pimeloyl-ACP methyl ester carboxylesterase n=1 Tax=Asanoa ishikariensis TaxID=137265 RepID=A0A1H3UJJ9_9ACTN|nr:alpha/beta hydrolase [Asanoa ishikariensis]SDZ62181.1 Pimeloyl-ACP methyl ester carboxylesterase [Asanoa ishikariensis]